jgi:hypothetical protein
MRIPHGYGNSTTTDARSQQYGQMPSFRHPRTRRRLTTYCISQGLRRQTQRGARRSRQVLDRIHPQAIRARCNFHAYHAECGRAEHPRSGRGDEKCAGGVRIHVGTAVPVPDPASITGDAREAAGPALQLRAVRSSRTRVPFSDLRGAGWHRATCGGWHCRTHRGRVRPTTLH